MTPPPANPPAVVKPRPLSVIGLAVSSLLAAVILIESTVLLAVRGHFARVLADLGSPLPALTSAVLAVPGFAIVAGAVVLAALVVAKEFLRPSRMVSRLINGLAILLVLAAFLFVIAALYLPIMGGAQALPGDGPHR